MLIIQLGTDENIKENIIRDYMLFIAIEFWKIQILKLFGPIMQKRAVEQEKILDQFHLIGIKYTMEP